MTTDSWNTLDLTLSAFSFRSTTVIPNECIKLKYFTAPHGLPIIQHFVYVLKFKLILSTIHQNATNVLVSLTAWKLEFSHLLKLSADNNKNFTICVSFRARFYSPFIHHIVEHFDLQLTRSGISFTIATLYEYDIRHLLRFSRYFAFHHIQS